MNIVKMAAAVLSMIVVMFMLILSCVNNPVGDGTSWIAGSNEPDGGGGGNNPNVTRGSFTDSRDGRTYNTVRIGNGKTWMAENLNYRNPSWSHNDHVGSIPWGGGTFGSWCYGNNSSNCNTYGRLYTWDAARVACPSGWRLPTQQDWTDLVNASGRRGVAGRALKARSPAWDGDDTYGFSALPGGYRLPEGTFWGGLGGWGHWWSATENGADYAWRVNVGTGDTGVSEFWSNKSHGFSVRCIRD